MANISKKRLFIEQEKRYQKALTRKLEEMVPLVYAAFALSLHRRYKFGFSRIATAISDTQLLMNEAAQGGPDLIKLCAEETGIDIMSATTARECGVKPEDGKVV